MLWAEDTNIIRRDGKAIRLELSRGLGSLPRPLPFVYGRIMAEVLAIITSSASLVSLCAKVSNSLSAFVVAANNVDSTVQSYRNEVEALSRVLASINTSLSDPLVQSAVRAGRTGHTGGHWRDVKRSMSDCEATLKDFDRILDRMTRGDRGFLSLSRRQIRLDWNSGEITSLKQQIQNYKDTMQVSLQMINLYVSCPDHQGGFHYN
jgi:Fungal N-terminal domain of STAND proteins